jgi:ABC-type phosphate/phosphonate transport system substrate-binding protein
MRDTDRDRVTHVVARASSPIKSARDLRGRTVAVGASDSPQATLIPIDWLRAQDVDFKVKRFDVKVGLHGDHVGGELDAFQCLARGEADASVMLDLNWERWKGDGTISPNEYAVIGTTDRFDHCNFTVQGDFDKKREARFLEALFSMTYDDPKHREMMDMEGLKRWEPGRTSGYAALSRAVERQRYFEEGGA